MLIDYLTEEIVDDVQDEDSFSEYIWYYKVGLQALFP